MLVLFFVIAACETGVRDEIMTEDALTKRTLRILLMTNHSEIKNMRLYEKIRQFDEERWDVDVEFVIPPGTLTYGFSPWLLGRGKGDGPDLIELTTNQMRMASYHGKLESLPLDGSRLQNLAVALPEGDIVGLKVNINPLIVYYNKDTFSQLGLEPPSVEWDWDMLDNTITALRAADKNVHIVLTLATLEWLTMSRYGGRIVDQSGTVFSGYMNGEAAVEAAEWMKWVGTKDDRGIPNKLIEGNVALAIDYAFKHAATIGHVEAFIRSNDRIGIAPLPGGSDVVNVAFTSGLAMPKDSANKDLAMELLRYLTQDTDAFYEEILWYTLQSQHSKKEEIHDPYRISVLTQEMKRSVPVSTYLHAYISSKGGRLFYDWIHRDMMNGQSVQKTLDQAAQRMDTVYETFKQDLELYERCLQNFGSLCH